MLNLSSLAGAAAGRFMIDAGRFAVGAFASAFADAGRFVIGALAAATAFPFAFAARRLRSFRFGLGTTGSGSAVGSDADVGSLRLRFTAILAAAMSPSNLPN